MFICGMCIYSHIISPKNIAVLYIMTNRYTVFWEDFYKSAEKNFLPHHNKHYFIFTDDEKMTLLIIQLVLGQNIKTFLMSR